MAASARPAADYWAATESCIVCGSTEFERGFGPRTLVTCDCCLDKGVHVECWQRRSGEELTEERLESPAFQWFCSEACQRVSKRLVEVTGVQRPLARAGSGASGEYTIELVRWSPRDRAEQKKVDLAKRLFNSSFAPLIMSNGRNLIDMVCEAFESDSGPAHGGGGDGGGSGGGYGEGEEEDEELFNFSTFRVLLLRKSGALASAATLRCFGHTFCEVPFVATRDGYRRAGHCRQLMQELEGMLHGMGVQWVIVPAMKGVLDMWTGHFGYEEFSKEEVAVLEDRVVMPDPASAVLVRKKVESPKAPAATRAKAKAPAAPKIGRRVTFSYAGMDMSEGSEEEEGGQGRGKKGRGSRRRQSDEGSDYEMSEEEEEEEEEEMEGLVEEGEEGGTTCDRCGAADSEAWVTSRLTEETLCVSCVTPEDMPGHPGSAPAAAAAADGTAAAGAGGAAGKAGGKQGAAGLQCSNCGADRASKSRAGLVECRTCSQYRARHNGKARPEHLWKRQAAAGGRSRGGGGKAAGPDSAAQDGSEPALQPTTPADRCGASARATPVARHGGAVSAAAAAAAATPLLRRREMQGMRAFERLHEDRIDRQRRKAALAMQLRSAEESHRVKLEQQTADQLGGHLLALVRDADQQQAHMQHAYEQRALEQRQALQVAMEQAAAAAARAQQAEAQLAASGATVHQAAESFHSQLAAERVAAQERQQQLEAQAAARASAEREERLRAEAQLAAEREARQRSEAILAEQLAERESQLAAMAAELEHLQTQQAQQAQQAPQAPGSASAEAERQQSARQQQLGPLAAEHGMQPGVSRLGSLQASPASAAASPAAGGSSSAEWGATAGWEAEPATAAPGSTEADAEPEAVALLGSPAAQAAAAGVAAEAAAAAAMAAAAVRGASLLPGLGAGPSLLSPAVSFGATGGDDGGASKPSGGRRRLTTGRSSGGARRRPLRSRPAPAGPAGSAAAEPSPSASQEARQQGSTELGDASASAERQPAQHVQHAQQGSNSAGPADPAPVLGGAPTSSEDWGRMFGMLSAGGGASGSAGDGVGVGDSSHLPAVSPAVGPQLRGTTGRLGLDGGSAPSSPSMSLDGVARQAAAGAGGGGAVPRPNLGAALRRALGSQESRSQGLGPVQPPGGQQQAQQAQLSRQVQQAQQAQQAQPDRWPAAGPPDAAAHLAAMQLDELLALPTAGGPTRPDSAASEGQGVADADEAMRAAADIAQYLAD
ncbi:hypothetical protein ABPG75_013832 [Micractinium tetrahymenae]